LLLKRIISAVIFIPIFIFLIIKGGYFFLGLVCAIIAVGLTEFYRGAEKSRSGVPLRNIILGLCIPVAVYFRGENILPFVITVIIFIIFFWELFKLRTSQAQINVALNLGGILYISYLFSYIVIIRNTPLLGKELVITTLFATWLGDTGAFTVGSLCGKHKLLTMYSSRKSIEGFLGGVAFSLTAMLISGLWTPFSLVHLIILGVLIGLGGQMGDFFESMLITVPIFFYYTKYFIGIG